MIAINGKEAYALFIASDFWKALSLACRSAAGFKCNRCGKLDHCQAHHTFYRQNWFDTQLGDLECVCFECHQKEHGLAPKPIPVPQFSTWREIVMARSQRQITREQFRELKTNFKGKRSGKKRKKPKKQHHQRRNGCLGYSVPFRPGMYEGITPEQARAQTGKSYAPVVSRKGRH